MSKLPSHGGAELWLQPYEVSILLPLPLHPSHDLEIPTNPTTAASAARNSATSAAPAGEPATARNSKSAISSSARRRLGAERAVATSLLWQTLCSRTTTVMGIISGNTCVEAIAVTSVRSGCRRSVLGV